MNLDFQDPPIVDYILSGFVSKHLGTDQKFNENNQGLGFLLKNGIGGGYYKNSLGKNSVYLMKELKKELGNLGPVKINGTLDLGAVTGYNKPLIPAVLPGLQALYGNYGLQLGIVPPIPNVTPTTLALQLRKKF